MMNFTDALGNMMAGKRVYRAEWSTGYSILILAGQSYMWSVPNQNTNPTVNASIYVPSVEDLQAQDWIFRK